MHFARRAATAALVVALFTSAGCVDLSDFDSEGPNGWATESTVATTLPPVPTSPPDAVPVSCEIVDADADDFTYLAAHSVTDGELGPLCHGSENLVLLKAWALLDVFTDPEDRTNITQFTAFIDNTNGDMSTFAYVYPTDSYGEQHRMSVNVDVAEAEPNEFALTLAHEFAHIVSSAPGEFTLYSYDCYGFFDRGACYQNGSLLSDWVDEFWEPEHLDSVDVSAEPDIAAGETRCDGDAAFPGIYAASHPSEDFAEAFSAFVFGAPVSPEVAPRLQFFAARPQFAKFRDRAAAAGLSTEGYRFEGCGDR